VSAVVKNVLGLQHLDPDDVLWDVGCDSLSAIEIVAALLDIHPGRLEPNDLLTAPTARELAHRLSSGTARRPSHVVTMHPSGTRPPLFLVAGGGSPAISYRSMVSALGPDQPVVIFEQIGMHDDAPPVSDIAATARVNLELLRRIDPVGPYVVAGHSWGGLVAHRMAADLAAAGAGVRLVLLDTALPSTRFALDSPVYRPRRAGMPDWLRRVEIALTDLVRRARRVVPAHPGSERYYAQFWGTAVRSSRGYTPPSSSVPTVFVQPEHSTADQSWKGHCDLTVVAVGGNHRTMVHREHIEPALDHLRP
jgi:thioesterase domain-containing protein